MEGLLIGYAEDLCVKSTIGGSVEIVVEGFVCDMGLAIYELRLLGNVLLILKRGTSWSEREIYMVCSNFVIREGRISRSAEV